LIPYDKQGNEMKKKILFVYGIVILVIGLTIACALPTVTQKQPSIEPTIALETQETLPEADIPTEISADTPVPTASVMDVESEDVSHPTNSGQISYLFDGKLWVYLVDNGETFPIATFLEGDEYEPKYPRAKFSPDGRYLAFNLGTGSWIHDFQADNLIDFSPYGQFFDWAGTNTELFAIQGEMECPAIENLDDQLLLNFDIVRLDIENPSSFSLIANIGGGLRFVGTISQNGEWASINSCGCYSECGPESLWHLPFLSVIAPPAGVEGGNYAFSSDSQTMVFWSQQTYGYTESTLYSAATDFHGYTALFFGTNAQPVNALWSPDDNWIGFTSVHFDHEFVETDRCVWIVKPDGSQLTRVECGFSDLVAWSPDSDQILFSKAEGAIEHLYIYNTISGSRTAIPVQVNPYSHMFIDWGRLP